MTPDEYFALYAGRRVRIIAGNPDNRPALHPVRIGLIGIVSGVIRHEWGPQRTYVSVRFEDTNIGDGGADLYPDELELIDNKPLPLPG